MPKKSDKIAGSKHELHSGESLTVNQRLTSKNGKFYVVMQDDANFVAYDKKGHPYWASNTFKKHSEHAYLTCQADGNLVLYNPRMQGHAQNPIWSTSTHG
jgi:hypothetical protein